MQVILPDGQLFELTLAAAMRTAKPTGLRWCGIYPEHQGHVHDLRFADAALDNDGRDVVFRSADGDVVAAVVPLAESGMDYAEARDNLGRWQAEVDEVKLKAYLETV